ncbi:MAG: hypothetical protein Q4A74_00350 [Cardiobacteriaceae bacterium]|nr:hypothetical protein [Cardiobacteriaceae bacterium]
MKRVNTAQEECREMNFPALAALIADLPFSAEEFIVFFDEDSGDYIQTTIDLTDLDSESDRYLIETRRYAPDGSFIHYRCFADNAELALAPFHAFYHDLPFSAEGWEDVSDEFVD